MKKIEAWKVQYGHKTFSSSEDREFIVRATNPEIALLNADKVFKKDVIAKAKSDGYTKKDLAGFYVRSVVFHSYIYV